MSNFKFIHSKKTKEQNVKIFILIKIFLGYKNK